jgi:protease-4
MAADENNRRQPHFITLILAALGALALVAVVLFIGLIVVLATALSGGHTTSVSVMKPTSGKYVAGIRLHGEVNAELADEVVDLIEEASLDKDVAGVLLDVNSPGGSVVASQEIYDTIARKRETLPVVAYVREMAASGAYYSVASASKIVANRGSLVGSIGVILSTVETTELMKWAKLKPITMKTGSLKDAGSPVREWTEADKSYLQALIEDTRKVFVSDVVAMRKLEPEAVSHMADGRVVLGAEAVRLKLVDVVGSKEDALQAAAGLAGIKEKPELIYIEPKKNFKMFLREMLEEEAIAKELRGLLSKILLSADPAAIKAQ